MSEEHRKLIHMFQKNEITEYYIYHALARREKGKNREVLQKIFDDELRHFKEWKNYSSEDVKPSRFLIFFYLLMVRIFGVVFGVKMLEKGEEKAERAYSTIVQVLPSAKNITEDEIKHEQLLIEMIDEERIRYISSMVLGLNNVLIELTGALAGFTLALQNTRIIGLAGLITGIAASLSMVASEYLSEKSEEGHKEPFRSAVYTGIAYILAVIFLVLPYFLLTNFYLALLHTLLIAILIILTFSYFVAVVKDISFARFFGEMVLISLRVATISFFIGWLARTLLNIEI